MAETEPVEIGFWPSSGRMYGKVMGGTEYDHIGNIVVEQLRQHGLDIKLETPLQASTPMAVMQIVKADAKHEVGHFEAEPGDDSTSFGAWFPPDQMLGIRVMFIGTEGWESVTCDKNTFHEATKGVTSTSSRKSRRVDPEPLVLSKAVNYFVDMPVFEAIEFSEKCGQKFSGGVGGAASAVKDTASMLSIAAGFTVEAFFDMSAQALVEGGTWPPFKEIALVAHMQLVPMLRPTVRGNRTRTARPPACGANIRCLTKVSRQISRQVVWHAMAREKAAKSSLLEDIPNVHIGLGTPFNGGVPLIERWLEHVSEKHDVDIRGTVERMLLSSTTRGEFNEYAPMLDVQGIWWHEEGAKLFPEIPEEHKDDCLTGAVTLPLLKNHYKGIHNGIVCGIYVRCDMADKLSDGFSKELNDELLEHAVPKDKSFPTYLKEKETAEKTPRLEERERPSRGRRVAETRVIDGQALQSGAEPLVAVEEVPAAAVGGRRNKNAAAKSRKLWDPDSETTEKGLQQALGRIHREVEKEGSLAKMEKIWSNYADYVFDAVVKAKNHENNNDVARSWGCKLLRILVDCKKRTAGNIRSNGLGQIYDFDKNAENPAKKPRRAAPDDEEEETDQAHEGTYYEVENQADYSKELGSIQAGINLYGEKLKLMAKDVKAIQSDLKAKENADDSGALTMTDLVNDMEDEGPFASAIKATIQNTLGTVIDDKIGNALTEALDTHRNDMQRVQNENNFLKLALSGLMRTEEDFFNAYRLLCCSAQQTAEKITFLKDFQHYLNGDARRAAQAKIDELVAADGA